MPTDERVNRIRKSGRLLIAIANIIILAGIIGICISYTKKQQVIREKSIEKTFSSMAYSMRKVAGGTLLSQQQSCDDWASYINTHDMTLEEAFDFLYTTNSIDGITAQIIDYDTLIGNSSVPDENGNTMVDYNYLRDEIQEFVDNIHHEIGTMHISRSFTNQIDSKLTVGFCHNIELTAGDEYLLMRTVPMTLITERWSFPSEFENAELCLINQDGDYIVRSQSMEGKNFLDFIVDNNEIERGKLESNINLNDTAFMKLNNKDGELSYFVTIPKDSIEGWHYVCYVPKKSIADFKADLTLVIVSAIGFIILIILDGAYILSVNRQLRESAEEIRLANDAKTQFLSSMSHDIRTPMNAIIGMTTLSVKHIDDPEYIQNSLKKITLAGNHLLTLINDILDISKIESGKLTLNPTDFSLAETATNLVNIVRPQISEKELDFNVRVSNIAHEHLFADELRINQIFINILTNAVKYTPNGGSISIEIREESSPTSENNVILTYIVSDTGMGMSEEFQKTMFDSFSRATDSRIDKIQGSGLGLAITKQMVDLMGGTIECVSALGKGTTFTVRLELPITEKLADDLILPAMHMLVVDDDEVFLESATDTLMSLGVTADTATNGRTAVEMVAKRHESGSDYPVVIVDWKMPDMCGIDTIRHIREKVGDEVPIIVVSAYDWSEIEEEAVEAGANGFINKPLFRSTVYNTMTQLLNIDDTNVIVYDEPWAEFKGLHLLVAEDNNLNWEIIEEILESYDITAERAENGKICVEMASSEHDYDAILMDVQMPVMNGREASREIRKLDSEKLRNIPIIAMTADAFAEDVQACLDAGMNGHIAKPIDVNKIFEELRRAGLAGKAEKNGK